MVMRIQPVASQGAKRILKRRMRRNRSIVILLCVSIALGVFVQSLGEQPGTKAAAGQQIRVYNSDTETLMEMELEEYVAGVVAAEMPASFQLEALKAQAVAARTFAVNRIEHPNSKVTALHPKAQITTSPDTCQAWIGEDTQRERWGSAYDTWHDKILQAVSETEGEVLCYQGELIEPVYHASCGGGATEAAEDVWGSPRPYLVSVPCNHPADKHTDAIAVFTCQEVAEKLKLQGAVTAAAMNGGDVYIKATERTESERLKTVRIGDTTIRGGELRSALGLKSTLIRWNQTGDEVVFITSGYGHGAGMCQYGADYYAAQGFDYRKILQHYYPGTVLRVR